MVKKQKNKKKQCNLYIPHNEVKKGGGQGDGGGGGGRWASASSLASPAKHIWISLL